MGLLLRDLSQKVFFLDEINRQILKCISVKGPIDLSTLASWIEEYFEKPPKRWEIKNRIFGNKKHKGLIHSGYLYNKKFKPNQKSYSFYLQSKGVLASFATTHPSNNLFFKNVIEYADESTKGKKFRQFITEYILSQIIFFLSYHFIQGIELTWQKNTSEYYYKFIHDLQDGFKIITNNNEQMNDFSEIVENFVILHSCFEYITSEINKIGRRFPGIFGMKLIPLDLIDKKNWINSVAYWMISYNHNIIPNYRKDVSEAYDEIQKIQYSTYDHKWEELSDKIRKKLIKLEIKAEF